MEKKNSVKTLQLTELVSAMTNMMELQGRELKITMIRMIKAVTEKTNIHG